MKLSVDQKGFTAIEGLLIFLAITIIGGTGFYIYQSNKQVDKSLQSANTDAKFAREKKDKTSQAVADKHTHGYVVVKEWGVKVKVRDADKVDVKVSNEPGDSPVGRTDGSVTLIFKSDALQDQSCSPGVSLYRSTKQDDFGNAKLINGRYYFVTGSPGPCSQDSDNQLKERFLDDFKTENVQQL